MAPQRVCHILRAAQFVSIKIATLQLQEILADGIQVTIHFHPLRDAPALKQTRFKVPATHSFGAVVSNLRKKLKLREGESLWCYIDNFSPAPDEGVSALYNVSQSTCKKNPALTLSSASKRVKN
jgi:Ubiquitin-like autophagy protein Apg12